MQVGGSAAPPLGDRCSGPYLLAAVVPGTRPRMRRRGLLHMFVCLQQLPACLPAIICSQCRTYTSFEGSDVHLAVWSWVRGCHPWLPAACHVCTCRRNASRTVHAPPPSATSATSTVCWQCQ